MFLLVSMMMLMMMLITPPPCYGGNISGQVDVFSAYIWRGFDLNPDHKPVIQPSLTYTFGDSGFAFNVWMSFSFEDKELTETDFTLSYDFQVSENIALSAGIIHYAWYLTEGFDFKDDVNHELYLTAAFPKIFLNPAVSVYFDFTNGDGWYAEASLGHSVKLGGLVTADLSASLGYNFGMWLPENAGAGLSDFNIGLAVPFKAGKVSITTMATYTFVLMDEVSIKDHFWLGLSFAF
jgi:uncharacterized protein (TIGR02001 family)